ncbi:MAG TPA: NAD(P)H-dependent glycerol-3-phosphate dehydrogenase [Dongiaceae bacterium]|nr:NAD(P)H-dependent glycerol-3-phosphate dehydrogenase [Dongiaceae bacterium]
MIRAAVLGAGSWGTALAAHLAKGGTSTMLWARTPERAAALQAARMNADYLPGFRFPEGLEVGGDLVAALQGRDLVLLAAPAQATGALARAIRPALPPAAELVLTSKGLELDTGLRLTEVLDRELGARASGAAVLSGPSFAAEVVRGDPTAVVVASRDPEAARRVQAALSFGNLRLYTNADPAGVELGGALKNVMAIATGIVEGLGLGTNTRAALITRGLAEMTRLGVALGARASTFAGLAGMGDLVLTCTGALSRNRSLGVEIGRGRTLAEVLGSRRTVAEGASTASAALVLAQRAGVEMPIAAKVSEVLYDGRAPRAAVDDLLARRLTEE